MRSSAYGLTFEARVAPPWFARAEPTHPPDVRVHVVDTLPVIGDGERLAIVLPHVGEIAVVEGHDAWLRLEPTMGDHALELLLSGPVAAMVLHQRGHLVLHASAVERGGAAIVFAGGTTWGKSTAAARLHLGGFRTVADDVVPLSVRGGAVVATPGYPAHKLWPDTAEALGLGVLPPIGLEGEKRRLDTGPDAPVDPVPVDRIFVLSGSDHLGVEPVEGHAAYVELLRHSYLAKHLGLEDALPTHLRAAEQVLASVPMRRLHQGSLADLDRLVQIIEADLLRGA